MTRARSYYQNVERYHEMAEASHAGEVFDVSLIMPYVSPDGMVLDVGGGTGHNAEWLHIASHHYIAVDLSTMGLSHVVQKGRGSVVGGDAGNLPFRGSSFSTILCSWSLEHFEYPEPVLSEMVRVLKPGGCIVVWGPNWDNILRKDFPQFAHKPWWYAGKLRLRILGRMVRNEFLPFRYRPYVNTDVAAFADPIRYISGDTDAIHCVLCQETYKYFAERGFVLDLIADLSMMEQYLHNGIVVRLARAILRPILPALRRVPLCRWFVLRFPLVMRKPKERRDER